MAALARAASVMSRGRSPCRAFSSAVSRKSGGREQVISAQARADAQRLRDFQQMGHQARPCSVAIGLGSHDLGVADTIADLYTGA